MKTTIILCAALLFAPLDPPWVNPTPTNPPTTIDSYPTPQPPNCPDWMHNRCY